MANSYKKYSYKDFGNAGKQPRRRQWLGNSLIKCLKAVALVGSAPCYCFLKIVEFWPVSGPI